MMFKAGDVVQLKSGGTLMTVIVVNRPESEYPSVNVVWFNDRGDICYETVGPFVLERVQ